MILILFDASGGLTVVTFINDRLYEDHNDRLLNDVECSPEVVIELKKQLREKDLVLTDIRLEALSSAHQLESLKDTVMKMRVGIGEFTLNA